MIIFPYRSVKVLLYIVWTSRVKFQMIHKLWMVKLKRKYFLICILFFKSSNQNFVIFFFLGLTWWIYYVYFGYTHSKSMYFIHIYYSYYYALSRNNYIASRKNITVENFFLNIYLLLSKNNLFQSTCSRNEYVVIVYQKKYVSKNV